MLILLEIILLFFKKKINPLNNKNLTLGHPTITLNINPNPWVNNLISSNPCVDEHTELDHHRRIPEMFGLLEYCSKLVTEMHYGFISGTLQLSHTLMQLISVDAC